MNLQPDPSKKDMMLQLTPTGVSGDFRNQNFVIEVIFSNAVSKKKSGVQAVQEHILENPLKLYEEWFTEEELAAHVDDSNRETIVKLNEIVSELNSLAESRTLTPEAITSACDATNILILGEGRLHK